jgi:hypothetical protein
MDFIGWDLFTAPLQNTLRQFEEADNFGSLIRPKVTDVNSMLKILEAKNVSEQIFLIRTHKKVMQALRQADYLSPKYHVVIANPPYMGGKGMNGRLGSWLKDNYADVKSDLFSAFMVRITEITMSGGFVGMMTPFNWMFLSSFEKLRIKVFGNFTLTNLVRPEFHAFFDSAYITICGFTIFLKSSPTYKGAFIDLQKFYGADIQPVKALEAIRNPDCGWFYRASSSDFKKIPGSPIAYWVSEQQRRIFDHCICVDDEYIVRQGLKTGDNDHFLRYWYEVSALNIKFDSSSIKEAHFTKCTWFPYNKGGSYRKWFGNNEFLLRFNVDSYSILLNQGNKLPSRQYYFQESITWTGISCGDFSARYSPPGFIFDGTGSCAFQKHLLNIHLLAGLLNSNVGALFLKTISPTISFEVGHIKRIPLNANIDNLYTEVIKRLISISKLDWADYETSWDFNCIPLLNSDYRQPTLKATYNQARAQWSKITLEMQHLEKENNRIFIEAYGLHDDLMPEVPLKEITLTCNPHYRYGVDECETGSEKWEGIEARLLEDAMKEFISYSVGCMFGRYSLDMPGLVLANQGENVEDYNKKIVEWKNQAGTTSQTEITFHPDRDNVIPVLDGDWFTDEIVELFQRFLHVTFGDEHYEANLKFIEKALGKDIRKYFLKDFYSDHVRRYKKRPIYWLFSSPKGSFNALIYMHRYRSDTVSVVLNDYLREFRTKLISRKNHLEAVSISANASQGEKTKALKEIESLKKIINELDAYERDVMYPLATEQLEIDLDDGVKVNYLKFGAALKKIPGLDAKGEE